MYKGYKGNVLGTVSVPETGAATEHLPVRCAL